VQHDGSRATLPFQFDTAGVVISIVQGIVALLGVLAIGVLYSFFVSRSAVSAAGLLVTAVGVLWLGRLVLANLEGTRGTITRERVVVQPGGVRGMRTAGPSGTFPLGRFTQVRVERIMPSEGIHSQGHERVSLVGKEGTPDIMIARADLDAGRTLARDLAAALNLRLEERQAPY
jgi:hypothetical protein